MPALLVILDGLGGRPTDFGGATCLERAAHPNLDELAAQGALGLMDPIAPGVRPGSDTAHLSIFGYDPFQVYTGRGAFEVLGIGMEVRGGDVCFRANFATVEERDGKLIVIDRRAGRLEEGKLLEEAVNAISLRDFGVEFFFRASTEHRGALVLRGENLSAAVSDTDPHEVGVPVAEARALEESEAAHRTAQILNAFTRRAYEALRDHPVNKKRAAEGKLPGNALLLRGAAVMPHLVPVTETYGIRAACVAGGALYKGVARLAGMEILSVPGATGDLKTDLRAKARAALEALASFDLVFVHIKGTDNAGHDGDAEAKRAFIERVDREFFGELLSQMPKDLHICVSGDHSTPPAVREHTADPVPALFFGPAIRPDRTRNFSERAAGEGGLGRFSGRLLPQLLGYCDFGSKFGA
ncbi:2,3-bisphosphoglycerate-independent phosphoglycerate mutase [Candidatus Bipolaricaulota bacterium]|nr:2,3-bisphosphoglycerate-independent phosphoglycerate mutase [Candidatus Bipolaricaulota bacterium]MBC7318526.1 2,3-bisphosphoglycerate-independent phosphoglycerate mutase [Candidatus Bipolaricaulota bacterium]